MFAIKIELSASVRVEEAILEAKDVARRLGYPVIFDFNDVAIFVDQDSYVSQLTADYYRRLSAMQQEESRVAR